MCIREGCVSGTCVFGEGSVHPSELGSAVLQLRLDLVSVAADLPWTTRETDARETVTL